MANELVFKLALEGKQLEEIVTELDKRGGAVFINRQDITRIILEADQVRQIRHVGIINKLAPYIGMAAITLGIVAWICGFSIIYTVIAIGTGLLTIAASARGQ